MVAASTTAAAATARVMTKSCRERSSAGDSATSSAIRSDEYQVIKGIEELFCAGLGSEKRRKADAAGPV